MLPPNLVETYTNHRKKRDMLSVLNLGPQIWFNRKLVLTDVAVPSGPFGVAVAFSLVHVEDPMAGAIWKTLVERFVPLLAVDSHPTDVADALSILAHPVPIARLVKAVPCNVISSFYVALVVQAISLCSVCSDCSMLWTPNENRKRFVISLWLDLHFLEGGRRRIWPKSMSISLFIFPRGFANKMHRVALINEPCASGDVITHKLQLCHVGCLPKCLSK